ncbi:DnaJ protein ERDJ3A [Camellia lanceoleosa]|uniref:DnaJ protein ERDJ3A n=1 Tax=Camellia lanceoleosa TaxID=1840588 RepID=A0ACC0HN90_9ERIC|nr:DnaJ protein ERDJ3A [Camellia lanceoleosa]
MRGGGQSGSFSSSTRSGSKNSPKCIRAVNSQLYKKEMSDQGMTWLLLLYTPMLKGTQNYESIIEEVANSLKGALKVGSIDCETKLSFCKDLGVYPCRAPKVLFIHTEQMTVVPW